MDAARPFADIASQSRSLLKTAVNAEFGCKGTQDILAKQLNDEWQRC
jgi:hypothetical protein